MLRSRKQLVSEVSQTATFTSDTVHITKRMDQRMLGRLKGNANTTGTLDVSIQHNPDPDDADGWKEVFAFTQQTSATGAAGYEDVHVPFHTTHLFPHFRAVVTIGGGGDYDVDVDLWFD